MAVGESIRASSSRCLSSLRHCVERHGRRVLIYLRTSSRRAMPGRPAARASRGLRIVPKTGASMPCQRRSASGMSGERRRPVPFPARSHPVEAIPTAAIPEAAVDSAETPGASRTDEAGEGGDECEMVLIAQPFRCRNCQHRLVDGRGRRFNAVLGGQPSCASNTLSSTVAQCRPFRVVRSGRWSRRDCTTAAFRVHPAKPSIGCPGTDRAGRLGPPTETGTVRPLARSAKICCVARI